MQTRTSNPALEALRRNVTGAIESGKATPIVEMTKFERQPATIARTADHYYQLRSPGIVTIGSDSKTRLERWARSHGFAATFVDERKKPMRVEHGF